jgi:uncharacterized repeat protein (TIGR03803 family)
LAEKLTFECSSAENPGDMQKFFQTALLIGTLAATLRPCGAATLPTLTTLYSFLGEEDGDSPEANLVYNTSTGALYGTTIAGGASGWGTVFELSPPTKTGGLWTKTTIHSFTGGTDGANPVAGLLLSSAGVLYGTTELGGAKDFGTVFSLTPPTPPSTTWTLTTLYAFTGENGDGANPESGLVMNKEALYGTTTFGGSGYGTVFSLTPKAGGRWVETVLYSFNGAPTGCGTTGNPACDGANPEAGVIALPSTGVLYGTTFAGGTLDYGTVYSLTPPTPPATTWTPTVLYSFNGAPSAVDGGEACGTTGQPPCDGAYPAGGVVVFTGGVLYGTTTIGGNPTGCPLGGFAQGCGAVFQLKPPTPPATTWTESLIYIFTGPPKDGWAPSQNLAIGTTGTLFGATFAGGSTDDNCFPASYLGCGIVYELKPPVAPATTWTKNTLAIFDDDNGGGPNGVVIGKNGVLYGTTYVGGINGGNGTVFEVVP